MSSKPTTRIISSLLLFLLLSAACVGQTTQTSPGQQSIQFIVIGDWGMQGNEDQKQVALQMDRLAAKFSIDFIVTTGDNFYPFGVQSTDDPLWQTNYEDVYSLPHIKEIPWYVTLGNHDYFGDFQAEIAYAKEHAKWILPTNYYAKDIISNNKHLVKMLFVDSNPYIHEYLNRPDLYHHIETQDTDKQTKWLKKEISDDSPIWKIIFAHHPLYTSGAHGETVELKQAWAGLFKQYNVHAYFSGHDHHLEHIKTAGPTHYFISGGGGAGIRRVGSSTHTLFSLSSHGFAHVVLDQLCMRVRFINQKGEELYRTVIPSILALSCETGES